MYVVTKEEMEVGPSLKINDPKERLLLFRLMIDDKGYPNGTFFTARYSDVLLAIYHVERNLQMGGTVLFLNDIYKLLNLKETDAGDYIGWFTGTESSWIDFDINKVNLPSGMEYYEITTYPEANNNIKEYI